MILVAYRSSQISDALRPCRWDDIDLGAAAIYVKRLKNGQATTHQVGGDELRALRKVQREAPKSALVFVNERGTPFDRTASIGWSSEPARRPVCPSRSMPT